MKSPTSNKDEFFPGNYYHVYNRAHGSERLFFKNANYEYFLRKYRYFFSDYLKTYAYCLMPNHFHLLVKANGGFDDTDKVICEQFRKFFIGYAQAINIQEDRMGGLFMRPFKRKMIADKNHLAVIVNYIHRNPVHHGLCKNPSAHVWNSYHHLVMKKSERQGLNILSPLELEETLMIKDFQLNDEIKDLLLD